MGLSGVWPQWRGPLRNGVSAETGLLKEWPKDGPPIPWKATGLGAGFSGVAVVGQRLFTLGDGADACSLCSLDSANSQVIWSTAVGKASCCGPEPGGARNTPTVDGA